MLLLKSNKLIPHKIIDAYRNILAIYSALTC